MVDINMVHNLYLSHGTSHFLLLFIDVQVLAHPTKLQAPWEENIHFIPEWTGVINKP